MKKSQTACDRVLPEENDSFFELPIFNDEMKEHQKRQDDPEQASLYSDEVRKTLRPEFLQLEYRLQKQVNVRFVRD